MYIQWKKLKLILARSSTTPQDKAPVLVVSMVVHLQALKVVPVLY
jgi:hypothetical protein